MSDNPPPSTGLKMGDLKKMIQDTVTEVVKGITSTDPPKPDPAKDSSTGGSSVADRVREEIEKIRQREAADKEKEDLKTQVAELAKATQEKAPVERGKLHKLMGWGENVDK